MAYMHNTLPTGGASNFSGLPLAEWLCVPSGKRLNVGSSPTVGAVFSAMKAEYVVVAEQAHPLGPAYNYFYPAAYKSSTCFDHHIGFEPKSLRPPPWQSGYAFRPVNG